MRAELAAIDDADARRRFARSAAAAAFGQGLGLRITVALGTGVAVAGVTLAVSRMQLDDGGPGVLSVTVPVPAILLFAVALIAAHAARSFRIGLETGAMALVASFGAVFAVAALEGLVCVDRHGVFVRDGDPPRHDVGTADVVFDLFSTGMWVGHVIFWLPWLVIGAALGAWIGVRRGCADADADAAAITATG
jgi:hypothetical protein